MKNAQKVISDHIKKIEGNDLTIVKYNSTNNIESKCNKCGYAIIDTYRNLSYKRFQCKYCILISKSQLVKNEIVKIYKIDGSYVHLICQNGHTYKQDRRNLLAGKKCKECYLTNKIISKEFVIEKFKEIHGDYYQYKLDDFKNLHSKVTITCPKKHIFSQKVSNHLQGKACPICRESLGERIISNYLSTKNINFIRQKKFNDCIFKSHLPFDFYLVDLNIAIEYDGIQHFRPLKMFGGVEEFQKVQKKDKIKTDYCLNNDIRLIRISYDEDIITRLKSDL